MPMLAFLFSFSFFPLVEEVLPQMNFDYLWDVSGKSRCALFQQMLISALFLDYIVGVDVQIRKDV